MEKQALFWVLQATTPQDGDSTLITGYFGANVYPTSFVREDGPCRLTRDMRGSQVTDNAGQIRVTATGGSNSIVTLPAGATYQDSTRSFRYVGGETLQIDAMGSTVPAFSQSITFPQRPDVTSTSTLFSKTDPFTATWTPIPTDVTILVSQTIADVSLQIRCTFPGTAGTGTIPASAFAELVTQQTGRLTIMGHYAANVSAGDYVFDVETFWFSSVQTSFTVR